MNSDLKKLLLYHLFNGIAISVVGNYLFLDAIFLRYDLDLKQFGFIKGCDVVAADGHLAAAGGGSHA